MKGIFSALLTPFDEEGKVKEQGLRQFVRQNIEDQQVDGLYVNGSSGENFMLSLEQKKFIFKTVKEEAKSDIPLIAQVGSINLDEAIELGQYATALGYDSLSAVTPFYYPFSFDEIKDYYQSIIAATGNQMIIYAIPALTGVKISVKQFDQLLQNDNIIGIKYTDNDFFMLERLRKRYPDKLIYSGFDEMLIHGVISGVDGAIGSTFNINGKRARQIVDLCHQEKVAEAYQIQHTTNDLIEKVLDLGIYQTLKEILKLKGFDAGTTKKPMQSFDEKQIDKVVQLIEEYKL
ncbi:N-acetylneuraminate lyase [Gracilibacillus alcaliphilus]|uniref:N-acetylneuraminate lyase n=1 Tax=Gracilibacillus alcaliphilus TaxID=1401441 RepID=UPI001956E023|nr:N-acetylneuraminate lyase [Gracilibacillus alcaliphilus]MBM7677124.1 N-acetylneuraminate lyase [Gracilibacillus alcaliphilus]